MHRFFVNSESKFTDAIVIEGEDVVHISKVLRLGVGDEITVCDSKGTDYTTVIEAIAKQEVRTRIVSQAPSKGEPAIETVIYQGIPKSTKMDLIIQKCTEMGIVRIVPVMTARTIVKLETEKDERKKVERWSKIAEEAAKQSKRGRVPVVEMPMTFREALQDAQKNELNLIPYELEKASTIKSALQAKKAKTIGYFIGPEGGFDSSEIEKAREAGIAPVTLGSRILRTETAGFALLSCIMYEYDQMEEMA